MERCFWRKNISSGKGLTCWGHILNWTPGYRRNICIPKQGRISNTLQHGSFSFGMCVETGEPRGTRHGLEENTEEETILEKKGTLDTK